MSETVCANTVLAPQLLFYFLNPHFMALPLKKQTAGAHIADGAPAAAFVGAGKATGGAVPANQEAESPFSSSFG